VKKAGLGLLLLLGCRDAPHDVGPVPAAPPETSSIETSRAPTSATTEPVAAAGATSSSATSPSATVTTSASSGSEEPFARTMVRRVGIDFTQAPLFFTASFDGSQRYSMWIDTMRFARELGREHGSPVRLTYFINTCYFDPSIKGSKIGRARTREEAVVRRALAQLAINAGHDVGNHGVRHDNGMGWSSKRWKAEFDEFHAWTDRNLFRALRDASGDHVFPRFSATSETPGTTGARCEADDDCPSGSCLALTGKARFCTQPCNRKKPCPAPTVCGAPTFNDDTDVCVPPPVHPIVHRGVTLFDADGSPNLERLKPYRIIGYRAPFLAGNDGLTEALLSHDYIYDASQLSPPGSPLRISLADRSGVLLGFPLMQHRRTRTIPMDYNYLQVGASGQRMEKDYQHSFVASFSRPARTPWNVGHHFSLWRDGAYWAALQRSMRFAAAGCPDDEGKQRCPKVSFVSFRELSRVIVRAIKRAQGTGGAKVARAADREPSASHDGR